ncbi:hypothetical protein [Nocardia sp. NPDC058497]|uniref:hypothetical protein n=1 Tax=Nocardia sp. NPDC058497 TaxID=3346529 RepID=UPI00365A14CC
MSKTDQSIARYLHLAGGGASSREGVERPQHQASTSVSGWHAPDPVRRCCAVTLVELDPDVRGDRAGPHVSESAPPVSPGTVVLPDHSGR